MNFLIVALTLTLSLSAWAKTPVTKENEKIPVKDKNMNLRQPSQILPLDEETERVLRASSLASDVVKDDASQKEFHFKAFSATKKISSIISIPESERLFFIYDCLFMVEEGFFLKYSHLSKDKLTQARKIVIESFE